MPHNPCIEYRDWIVDSVVMAVWGEVVKRPLFDGIDELKYHLTTIKVACVDNI